MPELRSGWAQGEGGLRLHYQAAGPDAGRLVLFLHGFPEFWYCWRRQLEHFGVDHLAVAPDLRGYNLSDRPADPRQYRMKTLIEDIRLLAASFTQERFVLVAHDWGGAAAWSFALAHPELLSHLVVLNAPHPYAFWRELAHNAAQQQASDYFLLFRDAKAERVLSENGHARLAAMRFGGLGGQASTADAAQRAAYLAAWSQPGALTGSLNWYRATPLYPPAPGDAGAAKLRLEAQDYVVRVPTLVIWGERDTALLPCLLDGMDALVPDLRVVRVPEASHWILDEAPELVNREIRRFIAA